MVNLTEREKSILDFITLGYDNIEIAGRIHVSKHTVKAHVSSIIKKLNARNRTNVVYLAAQNKLIEFAKVENSN